MWRFAISEALRNAWARLTRKQFLFVYPFVLGVVNATAFLAVYAALGGRLTFTAFAETNFDRWAYLQDYLRALIADPAGFVSAHLPAVLVAVVCAAAVCVLAAAVRAPFFRAIAGSSSYPLAPRSFTEFLRLAGFYAATYLVFHILPASSNPDSTAAAVMPFVLLPIAILIIFSDYALVFENLGPVAAVRRSVNILRKGWTAAVLLTLAAQLLWLGSLSLFDAYYADATTVFPLFAASQLLVEALITTVLDVVLIFTYDHYRKS